jgi:membrane-associated HD superfamily phosphohydrolase
VDRGQIVDENTLLTIESYMKESERIHADRSQVTSKLLGETLYVWIIIMAFTLYLSLFRKDYFEHWRSIAMLYSLIIIFSVIALQMVSHAVLHVFFLPFAFVPIVVRVFMDSRTAFMTHITTVLICACILQHPLEFIAVESAAGLIAIFSLRELSSRSQLFWTAVLITAVMAITNLALEWMKSSDATKSASARPPISSSTVCCSSVPTPYFT